MGFFKSRIPKPSVPSKAHKAGGESRPASHRAVEIRCPEDACEAAKAERGKRYLSKDAPTFPLAKCDKRDGCGCRYRHYEDRRGKEERRSPAPPSEWRAEADVRKRYRRAEESLEDPTVTEAQISLDSSYYGFRRR
jgi:hypothetical protein